ncbi:hypothetical protein H632_c4977p0, partial [Helicosporidium sp. ATCC 50920]
PAPPQRRPGSGGGERQLCAGEAARHRGRRGFRAGGARAPRAGSPLARAAGRGLSGAAHQRGREHGRGAAQLFRVRRGSARRRGAGRGQAHLRDGRR